MLLNIFKLQKELDLKVSKSSKTKKHVREDMSKLLRFYAEKVAKNEMNEELLDSLQLIIVENLELIKKAKFEIYPFIDVL